MSELNKNIFPIPVKRARQCDCSCELKGSYWVPIAASSYNNEIAFKNNITDSHKFHEFIKSNSLNILNEDNKFWNNNYNCR